MKSKSLLAIVGAVLVTVLATIGVALFVTGGDDASGDASVNPKVTKSAESYSSAVEVTKALKAKGADLCGGEAARVECRFRGRYVAATVLPADGSLTMETALPSWKTGLGQNMLGDQGAFAVLHGPNWLATGPQELMVAVWPQLGGKLMRCDRPFGTCR